MINPQWLELPMSRMNFHGPKDVRAIEVQLYIIRFCVPFLQTGDERQARKGFLWQLLSELCALHSQSSQSVGTQTDLIKVATVSTLGMYDSKTLLIACL